MESSTVRILLVEDNPGDARLLQTLLEKVSPTRFEVTWADRLELALRFLREGEFDVILLDLSLPDSHGLETLTHLHRADVYLPVIVLTGLDDSDMPARALRQGAQDYLPKGKITGELLDRAIRYAIERHRLLTEVNSRSLSDDLTGLYNRRGLFVVAEPMIKAAGRLKKGLTLMFIDLDNMKQVNDTFGHPEGDRLLVETANLMRETFRASDLLARMGGDEFAVLCIGVPPRVVPELAARLEARARSFNSDGRLPYSLALSTGVVHREQAVPGALDDLLAEADARMYEQKRSKRRARAARHSDCISDRKALG